MGFELRWETERFPVRGAFTIARSSITEITVVTASLSRDGVQGRGECRPYPRYEESAESVGAQLAAIKDAVEAAGPEDLLAICAQVEPGAAANALESAAVDWLSKHADIRAWDLLGCERPVPRVTAYTLSADAPDAMAKTAIDARNYPLLKVKVSAEDFVTQFQAVHAARPEARFIIDANEALSPDGLVRLAEASLGADVVLFEQPLPAGAHDRLPDLPVGSAPICADESLHTIADLERLWTAGYRAVNVKLDKAGGPMRGFEVIRAAKRRGYTVMAGCMVGTSLAMAPMVAISMGADVLDLDGPLLLAGERAVRLAYEGSKVGVPRVDLWG